MVKIHTYKWHLPTCEINIFIWSYNVNGFPDPNSIINYRFRRSIWDATLGQGRQPSHFVISRTGRGRDLMRCICDDREQTMQTIVNHQQTNSSSNMIKMSVIRYKTKYSNLIWINLMFLRCIAADPRSAD